MNEHKHLLKKTGYDIKENFEFMPGHRAVIEDIPKKICELIKYRQQKAENQAGPFYSSSGTLKKQLVVTSVQ